MSMNVMICHSSFGVLDALTETIATALPQAAVLRAENLTSAYHLAEHQQPQHILIDAHLAATGEFDLLHSLIKILKIRCWIIGTADRGNRHIALRELPFISLQITPPELAAILETPSATVAPEACKAPKAPDHVVFHRDSLILIGASTGGVDALAKILANFPRHAPPTFVVQHTGGSFTKSLIRLLDGATEARVRPACASEIPMPGHVYLAPGGALHLCLEGKAKPRIALRDEGLLSGHRPSIDALFRSAAPFARHAAAALLTGMGQDGARGLLALRQAGAHTIGQDAATSVVYGMPRVAMEMGAVAEQLPISKIGPALLDACTMKARA